MSLLSPLFTCLSFPFMLSFLFLPLSLQSVVSFSSPFSVSLSLESRRLLRWVVGLCSSYAVNIHTHHAIAPINSSRFSQALPRSRLLRAWIPLAPRRGCRLTVLVFLNSSPTETLASETRTFHFLPIQKKKSARPLGGESGERREKGVKHFTSVLHAAWFSSFWMTVDAPFSSARRGADAKFYLVTPRGR